MADSTQMVNERFPKPGGYGFEMVDAPGACFFSESRHQSKIYTESNRSNFPRIFGDLTSMQTLAIYRRLLVQNQLRNHRNETKETAGVARCLFCSAWHSGSGVCSGWFPERRRPNRN